MKTNEWKKAGLLMALIGAASLAQAEQGQGKGKGDGRKMPPEMMEKFDTDGDGQLNDTEKKAMRDEMMAKREEMTEKFDTDGDGKLNEEERAAMFEATGKEAPQGRKGQGGPEGKSGKGQRMSPEQREKMLEEFDADGDGKLNEAERATARETMEERHGERPEGGEGKKGKGSQGNREEMMKKYDTDADGKLSEDERTEMKKDRQKKQNEE